MRLKTKNEYKKQKLLFSKGYFIIKRLQKGDKQSQKRGQIDLFLLITAFFQETKLYLYIADTKIMKNLHFISLIFFLTISTSLFSQPRCYFEHYGADDGLPQHTVMDILQDKKGFMWFSTWDGLSKFDGYKFSTYKIQAGDAYHMRSNRIDYINEDKYGYIWTLSYDREAHRFDPRTEKFMGIRSLEEYKDVTFITTSIIPTPSGKVWLLSEKTGCISVTGSAFEVQFFNIQNRKIRATQVYNIHEDDQQNTWLLTNNGLYNVSEDGKDVQPHFSEKEYTGNKPMQSFYSSMEHNNQMWFGSDNGRIWIYNKKDGQFSLFETHSSSSIKILKSIDDKQILIATHNDGFFIYNSATKDLKKFTVANLPGMLVNEIVSCYIDKSQNIWFEMDYRGVSRFDTKTQTIKHLSTKTENFSSIVFPPNFFIFEDNEDRIWVHPRGGGFALYDPEKETLIPFYNEPSSPSWRFSDMLHAGFSDKQGNLWLSTRSHGLEKIIFNNDVFKSTIVDKNTHSTINNDVRCIFEDNKQNLWVSSKGGKIFVYDSTKTQIGYLCKNGKIEYGDPIEGICYSIIQDNALNIWIGTKGEGIYKLIPIDGATQYKIIQYTNSPTDLYSLSSNSIYSLFQDSKNRIWVGTYGGGLNLVDSEQEGRFFNYKNNLKNYPNQFGSQVRIISSDKFGNICVGTTFGLIMFSPNFNSVGSIDYKSYTRIPNNNNSLSGNDIYDICTTQKGETFLATFGGGLNQITAVDEKGFPKEFTSYTTKNGLPSDVILTITEDYRGKLWITTEGNLTKFDPERKTFETYSEITRLIEGQNFSEGTRFEAKSGIIYFGFSKGFISVNPDKIKDNTFKPYVALTNFQISNKNVPIGEKSPLSLNIDDTESLRLNHKQNFISIEFAALDYIEPKRIMYAYKMDGFDKDWIVTKEQRIANYTNLSPGTYTFRVKSTNSDGIWVENEHVLKIEITPSFWQTNWAYLLYFILFITILFIILRAIVIFYRLRDKVKLEQEQTEMKTRFFTDISHEIRTPLTMIVSPVENIIEDKKTPIEVKNHLQLVLKNANRMLDMVNQILDFRKIQKKNLNIQHTNIGQFITSICENFDETASEHNIKLNVENNAGDTKIWIDKDSIEKLVFNLLSNALKHTPDGKRIDVIISNVAKDNTISLQVKDEGRGMSKDILNKLFTRFASFNLDKNKPSTGIGLSIVKEVVDKHHASITVSSEVNKGSCFTIKFLTGVQHFENDDNITYIYNEPEQEQIFTPTDIDTKSDDNENNVIREESAQRQSILIVEDDTDLRQFIKTILEPHYDVLEASNGKEGYECAIANIPEFILSDIMMPEIDGVELLKQIRSNPETSHIPLILLTAKTDIESKLSGLDYGADDYITKPFSVKYLRARIDNIIEQRKRLYEFYSIGKQLLASTPIKQETSHQITQQDELFIKKVKDIVERNIDNSDFLVDNLVAELATSRTVFFKKLKSLTGLAPIEFIRDIKIKYAARLIESQQYTIKEVSFMIGISDTKYFTQCFKKVFNMTPSEYKNIKKGF